MELNWSSFVLEIINFLVLVWILKRFLYKPVLDVIARRRAGIESALADARAEQATAETLKAQYEGRLAEWDKERQQAREALARELEEGRSRGLAALKTELEKQREKARVSEAHHQTVIKRKMEETALAQGARFATRVLEQAAGAETASRLIDLVITELSQLPAERISALRNNWVSAPESIVVTTAFPLDDDQQRRLEQALAAVTKLDVPIRFEQDHALLAGVNITIGAWILGANLRDELKGFAELSHAE